MLKTMDSHFADWESEVFGIGYGTGEEHILAALRTFLTLCDKDGPDAVSFTYDYRNLETVLGGPTTWLLITILVKADIIEYGTSPRFAWLTKEGESLRDYILRKSNDELYEVATQGEKDLCTPNFCNCGPQGYSDRKVCANPFWVNKR